MLNDFFVGEHQKQLVILQQRLRLSLADAEDVFQDAAIALYDNIREGLAEHLNCTLSTYFTSICLNIGLKTLRRYAIYSRHEDSVADYLYEPFYDDKVLELIMLDDNDDAQREANSIHGIVSRLPKPCAEILWHFYGDNLSMNEIAPLIGYKNADTVKSKKSSCMSRLRQHLDDLRKCDIE